MVRWCNRFMRLYKGGVVGVLQVIVGVADMVGRQAAGEATLFAAGGLPRADLLRVHGGFVTP